MNWNLRNVAHRSLATVGLVPRSAVLQMVTYYEHEQCKFIEWANLGHQKAMEAEAALSERQTEVAYWRKRAEAAESNPEVKADTEAAFMRGMQRQQRQFGDWLYHEGARLHSAVGSEHPQPDN